MKYITRFNYDRSKGYNVRLPEIKNGEYIGFSSGSCRFFARSKYKTWKACLVQAIKFRDKYLKKNKSLYLLNKRLGRMKKPMKKCNRNTSGVIGVSIAIHYKKENIYFGYRATWCETINSVRKQRVQEFSQDLYGECGAFRLACRVRFKHCGPLHIDSVSAMPCFPDSEYLIN